MGLLTWPNMALKEGSKYLIFWGLQREKIVEKRKRENKRKRKRRRIEEKRKKKERREEEEEGVQGRKRYGTIWNFIVLYGFPCICMVISLAQT